MLVHKNTPTPRRISDRTLSVVRFFQLIRESRSITALKHAAGTLHEVGSAGEKAIVRLTHEPNDRARSSHVVWSRKLTIECPFTSAFS
jgi:hypothetical protein